MTHALFSYIIIAVLGKILLMKKIITSTILLLFYTMSISTAQVSILTASAFFDSVSETVGAIQNYEADITISVNDNPMQARVSFKQPNLLRLDFSDPATQVIVFNGNLLTIYLPGSRAILSQSVQGDASSVSGANFATPDGLALMRRYYSIEYETGQMAVPLDPEAEGTPAAEEMVIKLLLSRKNTSEGFRTIKLAINPESLLIRRVEAMSTENQTFVFDFSNYAINQNMPDERFIYDTPSSANTYNDFLFAE